MEVTESVIVIMGFEPHGGVTASKEVGPADLSLVDVGSADEMEKGVLWMLGEIVVESGRTKECLDTVEDTVDHDGSYLFLSHVLAQSCETHSKG